MKKIYFYLPVTIVLCLFLSISVRSLAQDYPSVMITDSAGNELNEPIELDPMDETQLSAIFVNAEQETQEVDIKWNVDPGYLGKIDRHDLFKAMHAGEGYLYAKYKGYKDSIVIVVHGDPKNDDDDDDGIDYPKVKVVPGSVKVEDGDSVQFTAFYINEEDKKEEVTFEWSVIPDTLGAFSSTNDGMFIPAMLGMGHVIASYDGLADTVKIKVIERKHKPKIEQNHKISIMPDDTVVHVSVDSIWYTADYKMNGSIPEGTEVEWSIAGDSLGVFSDVENGLLLLNGETGMAFVKATVGKFCATTELTVVDSSADTHINSIMIHRVLPDGHELPAHHIMEGESYKIGGLPYPLNVLNSGRIHFPFGSLHENITLYMFIPEEYAELDDDSTEIAYNDSIIAGVKFKVMPEDSTEFVEPYYFDQPLNLSLTFKQGLLDSLDVEADEIDLFFANPDSVDNIFVTDGLDHVAVDTIGNKIYAQIAHFSTIVARPTKSVQTTVAEIDSPKLDLLDNYPNPFSNRTTIRFKVEQSAHVAIDIFSLNGQKIARVADQKYLKGTHTLEWNIQDKTNSQVKAGVYLCRMLIDNQTSQTNRMIIVK